MDALFSGERGDDLTEYDVREVANAVRSKLLFLILEISRRTLAASSRYRQLPEEGVAGGASLALLVLGAPK